MTVYAENDENGIAWKKYTRKKRRRLLLVRKENDNGQRTDDHGDTI